MRNLVIALILLLQLSLLTSSGLAERPNILFIFSDDHAPHAIGAYGGLLAGVDPKPNIDRLAAEGMLFEQSFCTNSLCGPSRAVILTGKHSHLNGFRKNGDRFDPAQWTFPKELRAAGYQTAVIGKWHLGSDPQGFDYWRVLPGQGDYYNPQFRTPDGVVEINGHCTRIVTDLAEDWLRSGRDADKPFLLMCQHKAPHRTWMPAPEHLSLWKNETLPEPPTLLDIWSDNASGAREQQMTIEEDLDLYYDLFVDGVDPGEGRESRDVSGRKNQERMTEKQLRGWSDAFDTENRAFVADPPTGEALTRWKLQRYLKNYLRCVRGVDDSVGRLVALLDELGLADSTIVIYSSDQGFYLGDHGWYDKRWMYDESMRMPLIARWPGVTQPGARCRELVQNLDYAATLLDAAKASPSEPMQGKSFVSLLRGETPYDWRDAVYYHYFEGPPAIHRVAAHYGVRTQDRKLIYFYENDEWELYDLSNDPDELSNVYGQAEYSADTARLKQQLTELRQGYRDTAGASGPGTEGL
ncbi:MAG: sulfatase [Planctomycetota bacterium]